MGCSRSVLCLEELGGRVLPSSTIVPAPTVTTAAHVWVDDTHPTAPSGATVHTQPDLHPHAETKLHGTGGGDYLTGPKTSEGGTESRLYGQAFVSGMGEVSVTGTVWTVGTGAGQAGGVLTIRNDKGSLTIALDGPEQAAHSQLPKHFHYEVIEGTGAYATVRETGEMHLDLDPSHALGSGHTGGDFTLQFGGHKTA